MIDSEDFRGFEPVKKGHLYSSPSLETKFKFQEDAVLRGQNCSSRLVSSGLVWSLTKNTFMHGLILTINVSIALPPRARVSISVIKMP